MAKLHMNYFGSSVSISGDGTIIVVGAPGSTSLGAFTGLVRVYSFDAILGTQYRQIGSDIYGKFAYSQFGQAVSISADGTTFVAGAPYDQARSFGSISIYRFNSTVNSYVQVGSDINGTALGDSFGSSVSISGDGTTIVVGAPGNDDNGPNSGHVRVYTYNSKINQYVQVGYDIIGDQGNFGFGRTVSISADGSSFVIGGSGAVYVYKFNPG